MKIIFMFSVWNSFKTISRCREFCADDTARLVARVVARVVGGLFSCPHTVHRALCPAKIALNEDHKNWTQD